MGVSFVARKCTQCAGRLQYVKEKKLWKCLYCGAEIERQEQYDGLFTIKNVVRQSLLDTAFRRLDSAAKNLVECEKIDSRYVGTLIAKIAHEMISVITPGACSERDVRNLFAQLKKNYELLQGISKTVTDEEEALYEFLEEPDIFATLVLVYDSLNDSVRRDYVLQMLDAKQIYSKDANGNLLTYALKNSKHDLADDVLRNTNNINVSMALSEVLQKYPDGDKKGDDVYKGCWYFNANSKIKPGVVDADRNPILETSELYSGIIGRACVVFYAFNNKGNRGIAAGLRHLQKLADGTPLGGNGRPEDDFADLDDDDDDFLD